jgi:phosphoinositide-3-kinase regulatory subunit 4
MALDPEPGQNWLVTGSTRGQLVLWDVRFRLPVNTWQHPGGSPVSALALASAPPGRLGLRPGVAAGPLLYVAAGESEVGLWDVAEGRCLQVGQGAPH